jgi:predicted NBD/HSP70 family sugar kinase
MADPMAFDRYPIESGTAAPAARPGQVRDGNLARVLGLVAARGPVGRPELAAATGLTKSTISGLTRDLLAAGLIHQSAPDRSGERGRPGTRLAVDPSGAAGLGLEINVDYLAACVVDLAQRVRFRQVEVTDNRDRSPAEVATRLARLAGAAHRAATEQSLPIAGTTLAVPGLVSPAGHLVSAPNLGWTDLDLPALLTPHLPAGPPLAVDNEANLAALAELWYGHGRTRRDFIRLSGEIGIGAGIVLDGHLFRGTRGFAGEIGHVLVDPTGPPCHCGGTGCLETYAGQESLLRTATTPAGDGDRDGASGPGDPEADPVAALVARLAAGDAAAGEALAGAGRALGLALASVLNVLDTDTVVLGGVLATLGPWLVGSTTPTLLSRLPARADPPHLLISELGSEAALRGAAGQVIRRLLAAPHLLLGR